MGRALRSVVPTAREPSRRSTTRTTCSRRVSASFFEHQNAAAHPVPSGAATRRSRSRSRENAQNGRVFLKDERGAAPLRSARSIPSSRPSALVHRRWVHPHRARRSLLSRLEPSAPPNRCFVRKLAAVTLSTTEAVVHVFVENHRQLLALSTCGVGSHAAEEIVQIAFIRALYNADQYTAASAVELLYRMLEEAIAAFRRPSGVVTSCSVAPSSPARVRRSPFRRYLRPRSCHRLGGRRGGRCAARPDEELTAR